MKSACLFLLAFLAICNLTVSRGQSVPADDETDRRTIDDIILQRAESLLLRSIIRKMQEEDGINEGFSTQSEWVTKRQHPGKRYGEDFDKRQHPGRREEGEDKQLDVERRQHPGKREDEMHTFVEFQKRQHPGKRSRVGNLSENPITFLSEVTKRQHPGKRYLILHSKRQHPGKRHMEDEDGEWDWDADVDGDEDLQDLEKRQHPGKRFWDNQSPDLSSDRPCDVLDLRSCSKSGLQLLELLDNAASNRAEEKRQHPGKRFAPVEDLVEGDQD
ncbi:pro-thyrotropin-releasing hormone [Thalassophryne amazonica]|uniref:pro-thyrotropin-releasing hormone n=1 Tax=Thalassophryne amazonica TaxID=390379 RepID=UPI001471530A|nr:pro-thyrotropin-releasing hormone [Thalassophryne amazonica]